MPITTTKLLLAVPSAALGVSVTPSASAWVWSSWVEIEDVAPTPMVLQGYSLNGSAWTNADFEIEFGVGPAGAETTVMRHRATMSSAAGHNSFTMPVPMNVVNTGDRVSVRVRASVGNTTAVRIALSYYDGSTFDSTNVTRNILEIYPATGANGATVTPVGTTWGNSSWVQLTAATTNAIFLTGLQFVPAGTSGISFEIDLGTGASGSETVIHTIRGRYDTAAGWIQNTFPMPVPVAAGTRLSVRLRKGNAVTTAWRISAPYMLQAQRFTKAHTTSTFLFSYKQFKSHNTDVLKTSTTTTSTQNFRQTASSDDAMEAFGGGATTVTNGTQVIVQGANNVGVRIPNITYPQGTTITNAVLSWTNQSGSTSNGQGFGGTVILKAESADNASTFSASTGNIHNRARSGNTVTLPDPSAYENNPPNVTSLVQETLNRPGWVSGNAMAFLWLGDGSSDTRRVVANTVDNAGSYGQANLAITTTVVNPRSMARRHTTDTFRRVAAANFSKNHKTDTYKIFKPTVTVNSPADGSTYTNLFVPTVNFTVNSSSSAYSQVQMQFDNNSDFSSPEYSPTGTTDPYIISSFNNLQTQSVPNNYSTDYLFSTTPNNFNMDGHTSVVAGGWSNTANATDTNYSSTAASIAYAGTGTLSITGFASPTSSTPLRERAYATVYYGYSGSAASSITVRLSAANITGGVFTEAIIREIRAQFQVQSWGTNGGFGVSYATAYFDYQGTNIMATATANGEMEGNFGVQETNWLIYGVTITPYYPKTLNPGTYYYRARASDNGTPTIYGDWSAVRSFTLVNRATKSHTTDVQKRLVPSYTRTHTTGTFKRGAYTRSHTTSVFIRDTRNYSREDRTTLPTNNNDLAIPFSTADYGTVAADDGTYVNLAGNNILTFQFKKEAYSTNNAITVIWNGKSTIAPSTRAAYLQIWNRTSGTWETIDSNTTAAANVDFTMTGTKSTNLTNYYDTNNVVTARVYQ